MKAVLLKLLGIFFRRFAEKAVEEIVERVDPQPEPQVVDGWSMAKQKNTSEVKRARNKRRAQRKARRKNR